MKTLCDVRVAFIFGPLCMDVNELDGDKEVTLSSERKFGPKQLF